MPANSESTCPFATAAGRVTRWVMVRRWIRVLGCSAWWFVAGLAIVVAGTALGLGRASLSPWLPFGLFLAWLIGTLTFAWIRRPGAYPAFALWDSAADRREAFANAWWFEQLPERTSSQAQHVAVHTPALTDALPRLARDLPIQWPKSILAAPLAALVALIGCWIAGPRVVRELLDDQQQRIAEEQARRLASPDWQKRSLAGLTEPEKQELEQLKQNLQTTAKDLENSAGKDTREVLSQLEKRARDAEKLASRLVADGDSWASDKMIQELRQHADTADLGDAVAAKNAANTAQAADELSAVLKSPQLAAETRQRMNETLAQVRERSATEDRHRTVGERVLAAGDRMSESKPAAAAREFDQLAQRMREMARREQTRKELEKLAQQLRDAGNSITGQSTEGMQQMAAGGQQGEGGQAGQAQQVPQSGQPGQSPPAGLAPPGLGLNQMAQSPVPGTGSSQQLPMMMAQQPGQGQGGQGKPMLLAPIPGAKPDEQPSALLLDQQPPKGEPDRSVAIAGPSGTQPGVGKAELNNKPTDARKSGAQGMVAAQSTNEGQSAVRSVEGTARQERAARKTAETAVEFIQSEEEALDDAALPPSRRNQVRRYFTELRKRFEKQD